MKKSGDVDTVEFLLTKKKLHATGQFRGKIVTGSMVPVIQIGDIVEIVPIQIDELKRFDIIVFIQNKKLICHFVWMRSQINLDYIITKSMMNGEDLPIHKDEILGLCHNFKIPFWRKLKLLFNNRE